MKDYRLIDTHCHFDFPPFVGQEIAALQQVTQAGVQALIVPSVSADRFAKVSELAEQYKEIYAAIGLHPVAIAQHDEQALALMTDYLAQRHQHYVAIGEIGLDKNVESVSFTCQRVLLQQQLTLAKQYDLPVLLHSRHCHPELLQQLKQAKLAAAGVIHAFAGSKEQALAFIKLGYFIGVGGIITYPRAKKTRAAIAALPLTTLLLETDAPDMPISGYQGQPNRPERLVQILAALATLRTEPIEVIAEQIYNNSRQLFTKLTLN